MRAMALHRAGSNGKSLVGMKVSLPLFLVLVMAAGEARGQNETGIRFNLSTPGARTLAMGGAFIGLADDATAAYTNPAGLTNLTIGGSEVAIEVRGWRFSSVFPERGNVGEGLSNVGIDTVRGFETDDAVSKTNGLSFLSVGYVLPRGVTLALYRHELARFQANLVRQGFFYNSDPEFPDCRNDFNPEHFPAFNPCRFPPTQESVDFNIENYGISGAYQWGWPTSAGEKSLSLGAGASYLQATIRSRQDIFLFKEPFNEEGEVLGNEQLRRPGDFLGPADFLDDNAVFSRLIDESDHAMAFNLGLLWKDCNKGSSGKMKCWSLGGVYRRGAEFEYDSHLVATPLLERELGIPVGTTLQQSKGKIRVPDVYGLGLAYSAAEGKTKISLDYQRVRYSQRFDELVPKGTLGREALSLNDSNEVHLGAEHVFVNLGAKLVGTFRGGVWYEPFHEVQGSDADSKLFFPPGDGQIHWTGGLGFVVREEFQIDAAADFSERTNTVSVSVVKFF